MNRASFDRILGVLKRASQVRWQLVSLISSSAALLLAFQNCGPAMLACEGTNCSSSLSSVSRGGGSALTAGGSSSYIGGSSSASGSSSGSYTGSSGGAIIASAGSGTTGGSGSSSSSSGSSGSSGGAIIASPSTNVGSSTTSGGSSSSGSDALRFLYEPRGTTVEEGDVISLYAYAAAGFQEAKYQWYHKGTLIPGAVSPTLERHDASSALAGAYHVVVTFGSQSLQSPTVEVTVKPARQPCLKGDYGRYRYGVSYPADTYEFNATGAGSSIFTTTITTTRDLQDSYSYRSSCSSSGSISCSGAKVYQCQNAKLVLIQSNCACTSDWGGGGS